MKKKVIIAIAVVCVAVAAVAIFLLMPRSVPLETTTVEKGSISTSFTYKGTSEAVFAEDISAATTSPIYALYVEEGEWVEKGDSLLSADDGTSYQAGVSGTVTGLTAQEGETVAKGHALLSIIDHGSFQTTLKVDEYDVTSMQVGKEAQVTINSLEITVPASISGVTQRAVDSGGISYFTVTIALPVTDGLKIGMSLEVKMLKAAAIDVALLDVNALQFDENNKAYVTVAKEGDQTEVRAVTVGIQDGKKAQILEGLAVGDKVVLNKNDAGGMVMVTQGGQSSNSNSSGTGSNSQSNA